MAEALLAAGAAIAAGAYLFRATPAEPTSDAAIPENHDPMMFGQGIWKPVNNNVFMADGLSEAIAANAEPEVLQGGPDETGDSRAEYKRVNRRLLSLHRRNEIAQNVVTSQLFNPLKLQKYRLNGGQTPLQMAYLSDHGSVVPYTTVLDYSPFVLRGWGPIRETNNLLDYGPDVHRNEYPAIKIDDYPTALRFPPVRPAAKGPATSSYRGLKKLQAKQLVTQKRELLKVQ